MIANAMIWPQNIGHHTLTAFACEAVLQVHPMQGAKEEVAPRLWCIVHGSTSSCFGEGGPKFALQVLF